MLIFHHIAKTAGTSLRNILKRNYKPHELLELYGPNRDSVEWYRNYYNSLSPKQKDTIRCITAHTAHYIIPVLDQPFKVFSLLRDPVDRVLSLYYFTQSIAHTEGRGAQVGKIIKQLNWKIEDIYSELGEGNEFSSDLHDLFKSFFNGQARAILAPHMSTREFGFNTTQVFNNKKYEDKLWDILKKYYTIGIQDQYKTSVDYFAQNFGWKHMVYLNENITQSKPKNSNLPDNIIALIRSYNSLDDKLHAYYQKQFTI